MKEMFVRILSKEMEMADSSRLLVPGCWMQVPSAAPLRFLSFCKHLAQVMARNKPEVQVDL